MGLSSSEKQAFYKKLFNLEKEPAIHLQCCDDDPTAPGTCEGLGLAAAQRNLDNGIPVVLENFGRRTVDGDYLTSFGTFFLTDMIIVYVPGEKINTEFFKRCREINNKHLFDTTPRDEKLSDEEKDKRIGLSAKKMSESLKKSKHKHS